MTSSNEYMREYMLQRYRARKAEAVALLGGKCANCPSTKGLQFDHIKPEEKSFTIGKLWSVSRTRFLLELEKCQLLCVDCHTRKTCSEIGKTYAKDSHGTISSYRYCRCKACRAAKSEYNRQYKGR